MRRASNPSHHAPLRQREGQHLRGVVDVEAGQLALHARQHLGAADDFEQRGRDGGGGGVAPRLFVGRWLV